MFCHSCYQILHGDLHRTVLVATCQERTRCDGAEAWYLQLVLKARSMAYMVSSDSFLTRALYNETMMNAAVDRFTATSKQRSATCLTPAQHHTFRLDVSFPLSKVPSEMLIASQRIQLSISAGPAGKTACTCPRSAHCRVGPQKPITSDLPSH
jgi:hypothetical protein